MSFQAYLFFEIFLVVFLSFSESVGAAYENNPFLQGENGPVPIPTTNKPPVSQPPVLISTSQNIATTKEPTFTIEPPEILYGHDLNRKCLKPRGQFPSYSCKRYVNCWEGVAIEQSCLGNFLFNPVKLYCDYPENVDCRGKPITIKATPGPSEFVSTPSSVVDSTNNVAPISASSGIEPSLRKLCSRSTGLFPGSTCSKFVNCWENNAVEQDCPTGLYFSSEGYCDYPEKVHCDNHGIHGEIPAKVNARDSDCPLEFGNFRNGSDCGQYYTCAFFKVVAKYKCPDGFSFSDILGVCDYSYRVVCSQEPQFIDLRDIHAKDADCPLEFGNFRNKNNCSQYYTCAFYKVAIRYDCPEGLSFSDLLGICDYSYRVDCTKEPQFFQKNTNSVQDPGASQCTVKNGLVRDQQNCSSYYVCDSGRVVANYVCPLGFKFSTDLGVCDYEDKVNCNRPNKAFEIKDSNMAVQNIPNEIKLQVQKCVPGSVFRLNPQCTSACRCRNGVAEIIQCSDGLAYDSKTDKCISAHLAGC